MAEGMLVIDGSTCASSAVVTAVIYEPATEGEELAYMGQEYKGSVHPHPELKVTLDGQETILSSHANLAVILLGRPVGDDLRPMALGEVLADTTDPVVIVGYGDDETGAGIHGKRRINRSTTHRMSPEGGRILLEQPKHQMGTDDSGGPCLLEAGQGPILIGISNRRLGKEPTCTSVAPYRAWLSEHLQRAGKVDSVISP